MVVWTAFSQKSFQSNASRYESQLRREVEPLQPCVYSPAILSVMEGLFHNRCVTMQPMATVSLSAPFSNRGWLSVKRPDEERSWLRQNMLIPSTGSPHGRDTSAAGLDHGKSEH